LLDVIELVENIYDLDRCHYKIWKYSLGLHQ
jgi:hypothetical protein